MFVPVQDLPNLNTNESNLVTISHIMAWAVKGALEYEGTLQT